MILGNRMRSVNCYRAVLDGVKHISQCIVALQIYSLVSDFAKNRSQILFQENLWIMDVARAWLVYHLIGSDDAVKLYSVKGPLWKYYSSILSPVLPAASLTPTRCKHLIKKISGPSVD